VTPYYFAPGKRLFQIIVNVRESEGALGSVLNLIESRFKLVGTTTYASENNTIILNAVVEAKSEDETTDSISASLTAISSVLDLEVLEGRSGMLVDTFHTGLLSVTGYLMETRRQSVTRILDRVSRLLGSGGAVVLFEEGIAAGRANGEAFVKALGLENVRRNIDYLRSNLAAQGWGDVSVEMAPDGETRRMVVRDCFECSSNEGGRTGCHLFRGYIVGNTKAVFGKEYKVEETVCRLRKGKVCEFIVSPKAKADLDGETSA
jgi:predicted hydrocarbon binding protein